MQLVVLCPGVTQLKTS